MKHIILSLIVPIVLGCSSATEKSVADNSNQAEYSPMVDTLLVKTGMHVDAISGYSVNGLINQAIN